MLYAVDASPRPPAPFAVCDKPRGGRGPDGWRDLIFYRLDGIDPYAESEEYCRQRERAGQALTALEAMLPEKARALLREYAQALEAAHGLEAEILAERAFLDGVRIIARAMR